jgi:type IV secretory pathway VirB10-like protein
MSFRDQLIAICAERGVALLDLEGLDGGELQEAQQQNAGIEQLFDAIAELHVKMSAAKPAAPAAKTAPAKKPAAKKTAAKEPEESETEDEEPPAKKTAKKRAPAAKKSAKKDADEPATKKAPTKYAEFTSLVTKANKGDAAGWEDVKVTVSLAKVTASGQALLDHAAGAAFAALKGTEVTMQALLDAAKDLLTAVDGKVQPFKLSGLLWAAVGNANPFAATA